MEIELYCQTCEAETLHELASPLVVDNYISYLAMCVLCKSWQVYNTVISEEE